jgi:hypothetical protein
MFDAYLRPDKGRRVLAIDKLGLLAMIDLFPQKGGIYRK